MKLDITREEALSLLLSAAALQAPEFAILIYASDRTQFTQALYRARRGDPLLESIQIRQLTEGIALLNPHFNLETYTHNYNGEERSNQGPSEDHETGVSDNDSEIC